MPRRVLVSYGMAQTTLNCPHCGAAVEEVLFDQPRVVSCSHCGQPLMLPAADGSVIPVAQVSGEGAPFAIDDTAIAPASSDDELDGLRIRQIAQLRRATARSRSHALVFVGVFGVAAIQLLLLVYRQLMSGQRGEWEAGLALTAVVCGYLAVMFWQKSQRLKREYDQSALIDPASPPDLSRLSDGSQRWKNLEDVR